MQRSTSKSGAPREPSDQASEVGYEDEKPIRNYPERDDVIRAWQRADAVDEVDGAAQWCREKGFDLEGLLKRDLVRAIGPTSHPPPWLGGYLGDLVVPLFDKEGVLRSLRRRSPSGGRYAARGYQLAGLVMADETARKMLSHGFAPETLVITEGETDFLTWALTRGAQTAVVGITAGSWSRDIAQRIPEETTVCVLTDTDDAGDRYAQHIGETLSVVHRVVRRRRDAQNRDEHARWLDGNLDSDPIAICEPFERDLNGDAPQTQGARGANGTRQGPPATQNSDKRVEGTPAEGPKAFALSEDRLEQLRSLAIGDIEHTITELGRHDAALKVGRIIGQRLASGIFTIGHVRAYQTRLIARGQTRAARRDSERAFSDGLKFGRQAPYIPDDRPPSAMQPAKKSVERPVNPNNARDHRFSVGELIAQHAERARHDSKRYPDDDDWEGRMIMTRPRGAEETPRPRSCAANAQTLLRNHPSWRGTFVWNVLLRHAVFGRTPSFKQDDRPHEGVMAGIGDPIGDADLTRIKLWLEREQIHVGIDTVQRVTDVLAHQIPVHPLRAWLNHLSWDGVARVDGWLTTYCGTPDTPTNRFIARNFLKAAVARALHPGCKVDHVLVMEGPQGAGKSQALAALVPVSDWFSDTPLLIGTKDGMSALEGKWIVEIAELDAILKTKAAPDIKRFITSRIDHYRPPYARKEIDAPRCCVFAATINPGGSGYLKDETGNRRFWPVVTPNCHPEAIAHDRHQLWAEALHLHRQDPTWWPTTRAQHQTLAELQDERQDLHPWHDLVAAWLETPEAKAEPLSATRILTRALNKEPQQLRRGDQIEIGKVMTTLGYVARKIRLLNGRRVRIYQQNH